MSESTPKVYAAISAVSADMAACGLPKSERNAQQGFQFRGIDALFKALAPRLVAHNLVIVPRYLNRLVTEQESRSGNILFHVALEAEFDLICTIDGSKHTARAFGEAMDSGDKATAKAASAAWKGLCFQLFAIPTEGDNDPDSSSYRVRTRKPADPEPASTPSPGRVVAQMTVEDADAAAERIHAAFEARAVDDATAQRVVKAALVRIRQPNIVAAGPAFVDRLVGNIKNGLYDNVKREPAHV